MRIGMSKLVLAAAVALVGSAACASETVEWDFPRTGNCHEGIPFSDGKTGVLVWGGGDTINLTVGRADLWDHRGGYPWLASQSYTNIVAAVGSGDENRLFGLFRKETPKGEPRNPYMLPLGRVVVKLQGVATLKSGELDPFTGLGKLVLSDGKAIELAMSKKSRAFAMRFPEGVAFELKSMPSTEFPVYERDLKPLGFEKASVIDGKVPNCGGFRWKLPADEPVWLTWGRKGRECAIMTGRGEIGAECQTPRANFGDVRTESVAQWTAFWTRSAKVKVPDPVLQREFDYGMYRFGAMTDPDGTPAGLQGPWLEDDKLVPWNGDYHFNINVQECYSPAYRGGHFAHLLPLFRMVLSWRPRLRENARMFCGIDDGYSLPHSVDDRGVCIGGFWTGTVDHGSTAWVAAMMFRYVRYSGDVAFLRNGAYDFMKGAMNVYRAMMEEKDGRLSIPLGPSPEWGASDVRKAVGRDPSFQLAAAHRLARDLSDAAKLLGEKADPMWADVEKRLPLHSSDETGVCLFEGQSLTESHRHHSHLAGYYPFDVIPTEGREDRMLFERSLATWAFRGTGAWTGWCVPWAAILHIHAGNSRGAVQFLRSWDAYFCDEGHGSHHNSVYSGFTAFGNGRGIMQMDGQCAAVTAVMELMVHEVNGKVEYFRGCPESWKDVSFENVALADGRRVSGRRLNGRAEIFWGDRSVPPVADDVPHGYTPDIFPRGAKVLFHGDSITHGGRGSDMNHYLGHGYQAEIAMRYLGYHPEWGLSFANRANGGETSSNLVARWHVDAIPYTAGVTGESGAFGWTSQRVKVVPDVLSILIGINDYLRKPPYHVAVEDYERNLRYMVTNSLAANPSMRIVICQPFRLPVDDSEEFKSRQAAAERVARAYNLTWVPFQELFTNVLAKENPNHRYWFWDDYHPTYAAHVRMADFWLKTVSEGRR